MAEMNPEQTKSFQLTYALHINDLLDATKSFDIIIDLKQILDIRWSAITDHLIIGFKSGLIQLMDLNKRQPVCELQVDDLICFSPCTDAKSFNRFALITCSIYNDVRVYCPFAPEHFVLEKDEIDQVKFYEDCFKLEGDHYVFESFYDLPLYPTVFPVNHEINEDITQLDWDSNNIYVATGQSLNILRITDEFILFDHSSVLNSNIIFETEVQIKRFIRNQENTYLIGSSGLYQIFSEHITFLTSHTNIAQVRSQTYEFLDANGKTIQTNCSFAELLQKNILKRARNIMERGKELQDREKRIQNQITHMLDLLNEYNDKNSNPVIQLLKRSNAVTNNLTKLEEKWRDEIQNIEKEIESINSKIPSIKLNLRTEMLNHSNDITEKKKQIHLLQLRLERIESICGKKT